MTGKNLILIIGNGFDLAHGLETSFSNFATYFIKKRIIGEIKEIVKNGGKNNTFFNNKFVEDYINKPREYYPETNLHDKIWLLFRSNKFSEIVDLLLNNPSIIKTIISNEFLGKLYANEYKNWFDIENAYFTELIRLKQLALSSRFNIQHLNKLNEEFYFVKNELSNYLKKIEIKRKPDIEAFLNEIFNSEIDYFYIINFNYTNTIEQYLDFSNKMIKVNYIHGNLINNNIIFGYGNDQNKDYQEIKELEIDEFLKFFKTFAYSMDENYLDYQEALDRFMNYEVMILGHSLGLTDKTLLEEIFNSKKCDKIHFFKRSDFKNDYKKVERYFINQIFSASRIINNEKKLRNKVNNFKKSIFFP